MQNIFTDYDSMLGLDLDLVDIVTPSVTHAQLAILAFESGHNVLVEKPMAISSKECQMMIDSSQKNGRALCVNHNRRSLGSVRKTKSVVDHEELVPYRMSMKHFVAHPYPGFRPSWVTTEESGGLLWEMMVHDIYLVEYFLGEMSSIHAFASKLKESVFDSLTLVLRNREKIAICEGEWMVKEPVEVFSLLTREGDQFSVDMRHDLLLRKSRQYKDLRTTIFRTLHDDFHDPLLKWTKHISDAILSRSYRKALPFERTFFVLINEYLSYLRGLASTLPVLPEEGLRSVKILEAANRSIETGKAEYSD